MVFRRVRRRRLLALASWLTAGMAFAAASQLALTALALVAAAALVTATALLSSAAVDPRDDEGLPGSLEIARGVITMVRGARTVVQPVGALTCLQVLADQSDRVAVMRFDDGSTVTVGLTAREAATLQRRLELERTVIFPSMTTLSARGWLYGATLVGLPCAAMTAVTLTSAGHGWTEALAMAGLFVTVGAGLVWLAAGLLPARSVRLGSDGIVLRGGRYVPYDALGDVVALGATLHLTLRDDGSGATARRFELAMGDAEMARLLAAEMERAQLGHEEGRAPSLTRLQPSEGAATRTRRELRRLVQLDGYRDGAIDDDRLLAVVDDAAAPREQRIAAARALGAEHSERIRVAAARSAHPNLRTALERAADEVAAEGVALGRAYSA